MRKLKNEELGRPSLEVYQQQEKLPLWVILDNIRSMNNVGSVFRSADAFHVQKIYLCGITAQPPHREIHKTALGATESVDWEYAEDTLALIRTLKKDGFQVWAVEQAEGSLLLDQLEAPQNQKIALVFGNEVMGVQAEVVKECHGCLEIPQSGTKHSLNIAVSAGVILWEYYKQMEC